MCLHLQQEFHLSNLLFTQIFSIATNRELLSATTHKISNNIEFALGCRSDKQITILCSPPGQHSTVRAQQGIQFLDVSRRYDCMRFP